MNSPQRKVLKCVLLCFQVHDLEFAQVEAQVVQGLKVGNESLKQMHRVSSQYLERML